LNAQLEVIAYELLYRVEAQDARADILDGVAATSRVVVGTVAEIGLEKLSGGSVIHLNLPRELIADPIELPLRPETTVLEVLESVHSDAEVLAGINTFRQRRFRIAIDDYVSARHDESLLQVSDIVKIDLLLEPPDRLSETVAALFRRKLEIIAEKVETREQFEHCRSLGIQGFQGFWFQRPETFVAHRAASDKLAVMKVLAALQVPDCTVATLERLVQQDLALVYRLLRVINSSYYNLPRQVKTVHQAIRMLGLDNLRRLCAIVALASFDNRPQELLVNSLVRARMCEVLAANNEEDRSSELFLVGLLSHLDALLGVSTEEAVHTLPLAKDIAVALTSFAGPIGTTLKSVMEFERGDWQAASRGGLDLAQIQTAYLDAVRWADDSRALLKA
jgi:EAL and modified HD-GYP domain-containing signal transduction protein